MDHDLDTRQRLLEAAVELFSECGYRETTNARICKLAGANIAAINYYFGSKAALYAAAWRRAFDEMHRAHPVAGVEHSAAPPEERLRVRIQSLLRRMFDDGELGRHNRLLMSELANPTGLIEEVRREAIGPIRDQTLAILRELLGPHASERDAVHCEMSLVSQCLALPFRKAHRGFFLGREELEPQEVDALAEHIVRFSMAGIRATREWLEQRAGLDQECAS